MMRTRTVGSLRGGDAGGEVTLCGWVAARRDHGGVVFIDLRDATGLVQVVIDPDNAEAFAAAERVRSEYVLSIEGLVRARPAGTANANLASNNELNCTGPLIVEKPRYAPTRGGRVKLTPMLV